MKWVPDSVFETRRFKLGTHHGLEVGLVKHPLGQCDAYVEGVVTRREVMLRENPGPRAVLNAIERLAEGYGGELEYTRSALAIAEGQLKDYESRLGRPFAHEGYASQLADLRDKLKVALSEKPPEGGTPVAELAEEIKTLRASATVEAAPERAVRKASRAERPVTAKIRDCKTQAQAIEAGDPEPMPTSSPESSTPPTEPPRQASPESFRQQIARSRQPSAGQMTLW